MRHNESKLSPQFTLWQPRRVADELTMDVEPVWNQIDQVRASVAAFLMERGFHRDVIDALSMVACELTENATKYGRFTSGDTKLGVLVEVSPALIVVEVRNPVDPDDDVHLGRLDRAVQWIRGYQDPFEVYLARLREVSAQSLYSSESGLGLVRIAYEGQAILDFYVNPENILAVSATYRRH